MECIGCTACIDACDSVMSRLGRETGLIRWEDDPRPGWYDTESGELVNESELVEQAIDGVRHPSLRVSEPRTIVRTTISASEADGLERMRPPSRQAAE